MMDALVINRYGRYNTFDLTPDARDKIRNMDEQEFEKELKDLDLDMQMFLRLMREVTSFDHSSRF